MVLGDLWLSPGGTGRPHCPPRAGKGCSVWLVHPVRTTSSSSPTTEHHQHPSVPVFMVG